MVRVMTNPSDDQSHGHTNGHGHAHAHQHSHGGHEHGGAHAHEHGDHVHDHGAHGHVHGPGCSHDDAPSIPELPATASIAERWKAVKARVAAACEAAGRDPSEVEILAAVKAQTPAAVLEALAAGCRVIGHNRVQEAARTLPEIRETWDGPLEVHMIGSLQSNKVNAALRVADCVQSVDRMDIAQRLSRAAMERDRVLDVLVQVNSSGEETKGGVGVMEAIPFAANVAALPGLRLRGLMTIGANSPEPLVVRRSLQQMAQLSEALIASRAPGTTEARELSMGMSGDLEEAIAAGATMVRVGTAIFGPRA